MVPRNDTISSHIALKNLMREKKMATILLLKIPKNDIAINENRNEISEEKNTECKQGLLKSVFYQRGYLF